MKRVYFSLICCVTLGIFNSAHSYFYTGDHSSGTSESYIDEGWRMFNADNGDMIGENETVTIQSGDTVSGIAKSFGISRDALKEANPSLQQGRMKVGQTVLIPLQHILPPHPFRKGIVINIAEKRLYYFDGQNVANTFPVALGREGWHTPVGTTSIIKKKEAPSWHPPESIRQAHLEKHGEELPDVVPPGPENPLGNYAMYLGFNGYLIHGTNNPDSIGSFGTSGCIRLFNQDVEQLFYDADVGTTVHIVYYPTKFGWYGDDLYVEAHKTEHPNFAEYESEIKSLEELLDQAMDGHRHVSIDMEALHKAILEQRGIPVKISLS